MIACVVHKYVFPNAIIATDDRHGPHLATQKVQASDDRICHAIERDMMRAARVIRCVCLLFDPLVPVVTIAYESPDTMAIDPHVIASENECRRLILVAYWK